MQKFELYANELVGTIPSQLGGMHRTQHLHLYSNQLRGAIPSELGVMGQNNLTQFKLFDNELTGPVSPHGVSKAQARRFGANSHVVFLCNSCPLS